MSSPFDVIDLPIIKLFYSKTYKGPHELPIHIQSYPVVKPAAVFWPIHILLWPLVIFYAAKFPIPIFVTPFINF